MRISLIKLLLIVLLIMFAVLYVNNVYVNNVYKPQKPAKLSGYFLDIFNISKGEGYFEIPSNATEIIRLNYSVLENYPKLKNALKEDGKAIDLTDDEALLIIKNFDGKVVEFNKNYYMVAIGKY